MDKENKVNIEEFLLKDTENILRLPCICKNEQTGGEWSIYPMTVRQMAEIYPYISKIEKGGIEDIKKIAENGDGDFSMDDYLEFYNKYASIIDKIVTVMVGKDISGVATYEDYMYMFLATIYRMNNKSFLKSISYAKVLSLSNNAELIAAENRYTTSLSL